MKLVIFGSTGSIGSHVVEQALEQGHTVTAFVRNPDKLNVQHPNLSIFTGDVMNPDLVEEAVVGHEAAICILGSGKKLSGNVRSQGTKNIIQALEKAGIKRFICQSTLGAGDSWSNLNFYWKYIMFGFILRKVFADHQIQEEYVRHSNLDWTIIRPGAFIEGTRTGKYRHGFPGSDRTSNLTISRPDVADFILKQLGDNTYLGKAASLSY
ncbi:NAD(P)-dependent oxidoreductase [Myxosarcina sp. GI1]|uniref:NAD(P)-dependent oxidoreductase n=1 Tax=Myxosarcina sp. GI1 TaxID=1541065 RepID=UPI00056175E6|nr:SDR family oxidoreductase [Myxosarcina sp. GI1]